jgi:hypothetical protein
MSRAEPLTVLKAEFMQTLVRQVLELRPAGRSVARCGPLDLRAEA